MPRWVGRLLWSMRGKHRCTLHLDSRTPGIEGLTLEGVFLGRWKGHYVLKLPKWIRGVDETIVIDARFIEIPRERVIFKETHDS